MGDLDISQKDPYFVAVKIFLEKDDCFLVLKDKFGDWDLPGGRIKKSEFNTPFLDIIARKMCEEVGDAIQYNVMPLPDILMRHERVEASPGNPTVHILGLGFRATYLAGSVQLFDSHTEYLWADKNNFIPENYFTGGWLSGVSEYLHRYKN